MMGKQETALPFMRIPTVLSALERLGKGDIPITLALKVQQIHRSLRDSLEDAIAVKKNILAKYAEHTKQGQLVQDKHGNAVFDPHEKKWQAVAEINAAFALCASPVARITWHEIGIDEKQAKPFPGLAAILIDLDTLFLDDRSEEEKG